VLKISELLARFGLHAGGMRFVSIYRKDQPEKAKGVIISATLISFINGILLGSAIYCFSGFIAEALFKKKELHDVLKAFAFSVPFMSTMMIVATTSQGFHTTKYFVCIRDIIQPAAGIALILLFISLELGLYWVIYAFAISHIIALLAGLYFIDKRFSKVHRRSVKPVYETGTLLRYSAPLLFSGFLLFLVPWTAIIMLGYMNNPAGVGIYRAASQIPVFLVLILVATNSIYAPAIAEMHHLKQKDRMNKIFKTTTLWVFIFTLPLVLILFFSAKDIMAIFGSVYVETGAPVLMVLAVAQFTNCVTGGVALTLSMTGKQHVEMINSLLLVMMSIALNYFLIPVYGPLGAAIATGISIAVINLVRLVEVYIIYKIHPYDMGYVQGIISALVTFA